MRCFAPNHICIGSVSKSAADGLFKTILHLEEALVRTSAVNEGTIAFVNIARDEIRSVCISTSYDDGWYIHHIGCKSCRNKFIDCLTGWNQNFSTEVSAFFC